MKAQEERYRWIFQILAGKKPEETSQTMGSYGVKNATNLYRCIGKVEILDGLNQEYAEEILANNYYIGVRVYNHILKRYYSKKRVDIYIRKNEQCLIKVRQKEGMIVIYIPDLNDGFDGL